VTLLETLVAIVILGLAAVGFLGAFQASSQATRNSEAWVNAVAHAETAMEETKLGDIYSQPGTEPLPGGYRREVSVQPWTGSESVQLVTVTIMLPGGGVFVLRRLARAP
jgi:type II secretory pathway pseudopilin PulG